MFMANNMSLSSNQSQLLRGRLGRKWECSAKVSSKYKMNVSRLSYILLDSTMSFVKTSSS